MNNNSEENLELLKRLSCCKCFLICDLKYYQMVNKLKESASPIDRFFVKNNEDNFNVLYDFYRLYEFTDAITIILDSDQFGSLLNYYNNGILNGEEIIEVLLHE